MFQLYKTQLCLVHREGGRRARVYKYARTKEQDDSDDVGGTGGEGFSPPFSTVAPQRRQGDSLGEHQHDRADCTDGPTVGHQEEINHLDVSTGEFQQGLQVTKIVIEHIGTTER